MKVNTLKDLLRSRISQISDEKMRNFLKLYFFHKSSEINWHRATADFLNSFPEFQHFGDKNEQKNGSSMPPETSGFSNF